MNFDFTKTIINGLKFWTKEFVEDKVTSVEDKIITSETNSKTYTDEQISSSEESTKSYIDEQVGSIEIPEQVQSNLSEADSTSVSYVDGVVQQRHLPEGYPYSEVEFAEIVPSQSVTTAPIAELGNLNGNMSFPPSETVIEAGFSYIVSFDGVEYECVASGDDSSVILGNTVNGIMGNGDDTGEPFCIMKQGSSVAIITKEAGTYTIGISGEVEVNYPLDGKYIPTFVVDATNLPTTTKEWGELHEKLKNAWNSGARILLDRFGDGKQLLRCSNWDGAYGVFIEPSQDFFEVYSLTAMSFDGGSLTKHTIARNDDIPEGLPTVTTDNNGQFLRVVDGKWQAVTLETEDWTFTLEDGSSVTKKVAVLS